MSFHDVRLPARLAFGSTGGVERRTEIVTLASGHERRSSPWACGRRRWLIGAHLRTLADTAALVAFFEARRGRLHGFRYRDFADDRSCLPGVEPVATDQRLGVGDGRRTRFELVKSYGEGEGAFERQITRPVADSVRVALDGVDLAPADFDLDGGTVVLVQPPDAGVQVTAGFRFDVPVRFDSDRIETTLESFEAGRMAPVALIEIRD